MLIKELLLSYYKTQCLYAISELTIADYLESGPKSYEELALLSKTDPSKLYRVMRFLAAEGLFLEYETGIFGLSEESQLLCSSHNNSLRHFIKLHGGCFYQSAGRILDSLFKAEATSFEIEYHLPAYQYFGEHPEISAIYHAAMSENSRYYSRLFLEKVDFSPYRKIIDVGGGQGALLTAILKNNLQASGVVFDIPSLEAEAADIISKLGLSDRCEFVGGSFFNVIPAKGDLYILKSILHGKDDDSAIKIINNIKEAMADNAIILVIDRVIDKEIGYQQGCINDINMLNVTRGGDRTHQQFELLAQQCDLKINNAIYLEDAHMAIAMQ